MDHPLPIYALLVLNTLKQMHPATLHEIAEALKRDESRIKAVVEALLESGLVEAIGNGCGGNYILSPKPTGEKIQPRISGKKELMNFNMKNWFWNSPGNRSPSNGQM